MRQRPALQPKRPDLVRACRKRSPGEDQLGRGAIAVLEPCDALQDGLGRTERDPTLLPAIVEPRPEEPVQVDDVIGMVVRHDGGIEADRRGGSEQRKQPRQRPVAEIERHAEPVVLQ
jgi:hypothetical protein